MNESKLPHAIASAAVSLLGWLASHGSGAVLFLSGLAAIASLYATYLTVQVKRMEKQHLKNIDPDL